MIIKRLLLLLFTAFIATGCMSVDVRLDQPLDETKNGLRLQLIGIKEAAHQMEARLPSDHAKVIQRATDRAYNWRGDAPEAVYEYLLLTRQAKVQIDGFNNRFERAKRNLYHLDMNDEAAKKAVQREIYDLRRELQSLHDRNLLQRIYNAAQEINRL